MGVGAGIMGMRAGRSIIEDVHADGGHLHWEAGFDPRPSPGRNVHAIFMDLVQIAFGLSFIVMGTLALVR